MHQRPIGQICRKWKMTHRRSFSIRLLNKSMRKSIVIPGSYRGFPCCIGTCCSTACAHPPSERKFTGGIGSPFNTLLSIHWANFSVTNLARIFQDFQLYGGAPPSCCDQHDSAYLLWRKTQRVSKPSKEERADYFHGVEFSRIFRRTKMLPPSLEQGGYSSDEATIVQVYPIYSRQGAYIRSCHRCPSNASAF